MARRTKFTPQGGTPDTPSDGAVRVLFLRVKTPVGRGPVALLDQIRRTGHLEGKRPVLELHVAGRSGSVLVLDAADLPVVAREWALARERENQDGKNPPAGDPGDMPSPLSRAGPPDPDPPPPAA
jgi:hypothetical protein